MGAEARRMDVPSVVVGLDRALGDAAVLRRRFRGGDIFPQADIYGIWPTLTLLYTILEQSLKVLAEISAPGYLTKMVARGKQSKPQAQWDGHRLRTVHEKLHPSIGATMQENYEQLISLVRCGLDERSRSSPPDSLAEYLGRLDGAGLSEGNQQGAVLWRYALLEHGGCAGVHRLPEANADIMHEIARHALRLALLAKDASTLDGVDNSRWLKVSFVSHLNAKGWNVLRQSNALPAFPMDTAAGVMTIEDYYQWRGKGYGGWLNAVLDQVSIGAMLQYDKPAVRAFAEGAVRAMQQGATADPTRDPDLEFLLYVAGARRVRLNGGTLRFEHGPKRPDDVRLHSHKWWRGWSLRWEVDGQKRWEGELPVDMEYPWCIPDRKGQVLHASWGHEHGRDGPRPPFGAVADDETGVVALYYKPPQSDSSKRLVHRFRAIAWNVTLHDEEIGCIVASEDDVYVGERASAARMGGLGTAYFLRIDEGDEWRPADNGQVRNSDGQTPYAVGLACGSVPPMPRYKCGQCGGTGFCPACMGRPTDEGACNVCQSNGLCGKCDGHGCIGDHLIAQHALGAG